MAATTTKNVKFKNRNGHLLSGRIDIPNEVNICAYGVFAHCFTCGKNFTAANKISKALAKEGVAMLRFDFTGIGESEGEFSETNFTTRVEDIISAGDFLSEEFEAPKLLVGHSFGGAAALAACKDMDYINTVATIAAPANPEHVLHILDPIRSDLDKDIDSEISLPSGKFVFKKQFIDDALKIDFLTDLKRVRKSFLVMHSPFDDTVEISNASEIFMAQKHPKSFLTLDYAEHLLTKPKDSEYCGQMIYHWAKRYFKTYNG
ncbi:MAG: alpha/beta hydrolase family protein [Bdellovibrionales bacterium]